MGTPFLGSHSTLYDTCDLRVSIALQAGREASPYLVRYLLQKNLDLDEIVHRFCEMVENVEFRFPIVCFYETLRADYKAAMEGVQSRNPELPRDLRKRLKAALDSDLTMIVGHFFLNFVSNTFSMRFL